MPEQNFKISIDTGASATKFTYESDEGELKCQTMTPYCAQVSEQTTVSKGKFYDSGVIPPLESSWVSEGDRHYLLGLSAQKYHGSGVLDGDRKFEKSLYKILGILSHVSYAEDILRPIDLGILLPFDEYATKFELERSLRDVTSRGFSYCDRPQSLKLGTLKIRPEGCGTYLQGIKDGVDRSKLIASLVVGHRNCSYLVGLNGQPQEHLCQTCDLGFRWVVSEVRRLTGYKGELSITEQVVSGEMPSDMEEAYNQALLEYWSLLQRWLLRQVPVTHVVASGGGAINLKPFLQKLYKSKISWADAIAKEISNRGVKDKSLVRRVTDCYGIYLSLETRKAVIA